MKKTIFSTLMIAGLMGSSFAAVKVQAQDSANDSALYLNSADLSDAPVLPDNEIGYRINTDDLSTTFLVNTDVQRAFAAEAHLRDNLPAGELPTVFLPIIDNITKIMDQTATKTAEANDGLTHKQLATKIVRMSFCLGTDPYAMARQIEVESHFDQGQKSPTGAVGLVQATAIGIDEVNDQYGNRGITGANITAVIPYLDTATSCYLGGQKFVSMVDAGVIPKGSVTNKNAAARAQAKAWLRASIDRQLLYGQINMKVLLAHARARGLSGKSAYTSAFEAYNGDHHHSQYIKYANEIVGLMTKE